MANQPSRPTDEKNIPIVESYLEWLRQGKTATSWRRDYPNAVGVATLCYWRKASPEFAQAEIEARSEGVEILAADALDIADRKDVTKDDCAVQVARDKLRVWTRLQVGEWHRPRKQLLEHSGRIETTALSDTERAARIAAILHGARKRENMQDSAGDDIE